jgi:hypothetical protein
VAAKTVSHGLAWLRLALLMMYVTGDWLYLRTSRAKDEPLLSQALGTTDRLDQSFDSKNSTS